MQSPNTKYSELYSAFKSIEGQDEYREIISFVEHYKKDIYLLEFPEYFELMVCFTDALFEVGNYKKYLFYIDSIIESSIFNNIKYYRGENIFQKLLFRKAASHFQLEDYSQAIHIIQELLKLDPTDKLNQRFLFKCYLKSTPEMNKLYRAIAILLFLVVGLVTAIELLLIRHFYIDYITLFERSRNILFFTGLIILLLGNGSYYYSIKVKIRQFLKSI